MTNAEVVERIRKALRLARKAATDGEKSAAMEAARRMAKSYGIDLAEIAAEGVADGGKAIVVNGRTVDIDAIETQLAVWIMSRHFSIAVAFERTPKGKTRILWIGNSLNIGVAQYAWAIMIRESVANYDATLRAKKINPAYRSLYMKGFYFGIDQLLTAHPLRNDIEQANAEKRKADELLKKREEEQSFKLSNPNGDGGETDGDAIVRGVRDGRKVRLNRPMGNDGETRKPIAETRAALLTA